MTASGAHRGAPGLQFWHRPRVEPDSAAVEAPVTVDFEGGYSEDDVALADNVSRLLETGVIGINARTDVFFEHGGDAAQAVGEALDRAKAYAAAGASGFFPGLVDDALIGRICEGVMLPVNVMVMDGVPSNARLSELGVARISYGPIPYIRAMKMLEQEARTTSNEAAGRSEAES